MRECLSFIPPLQNDFNIYSFSHYFCIYPAKVSSDSHQPIILNLRGPSIRGFFSPRQLCTTQGPQLCDGPRRASLWGPNWSLLPEVKEKKSWKLPVEQDDSKHCVGVTNIDHRTVFSSYQCFKKELNSCGQARNIVVLVAKHWLSSFFFTLWFPSLCSFFFSLKDFGVCVHRTLFYLWNSRQNDTSTLR